MESDIRKNVSFLIDFVFVDLIVSYFLFSCITTPCRVSDQLIIYLYVYFSVSAVCKVVLALGNKQIRMTEAQTGKTASTL